jgi:Cu-processing system permease protein
LLIGKFLGLSAVLAIANLFGFGVAGGVIAINVKGVMWGEYLVFILSSILLGVVFIAIALLFSSIFKKRSTSLGGAIFLWFLFAVIWGIILSGIIIAQYGTDVITDENWMGPTWYYIASIINPISAFSVLVSLNVTPISTSIIQLPDIYTTPVMLLVLFSWIVITLTVSYYMLIRKDL